MAKILKMAEAHSVTIGGEKYPAKLSFRALARLEEITGKTYWQLVDTLTTGTIKYIPEMLFSMLEAGGTECSLDDLKDYPFTQEGIDNIYGMMVDITYAQMPTKEEDAKSTQGELKTGEKPKTAKKTK